MGKKWQKNALAGMTADRKTYWFYRICRLAMSSIRWTGLPDYIPVPILEKYVTMSGRANMYYDDVWDRYFIGTDASVGNLDVYGQPTQRALTFANGTIVTMETKDSVLISNNVMSMPDLWMYEILAGQLADLDMAIMVNCNTQKTMPIIPTNQQQKMTVENAYKMQLQNIPYLLVDNDSFNLDGFKSALQFDNRKSFTADQLMVVQRELWNRCLTLLGINNVNVEKRERVNVYETNSNLDEIMCMRASRLDMRRWACNKMKEKWGLDVWCDYVSDIRGTGGEENGMVYYGGADNMRTDVSQSASRDGSTDDTTAGDSTPGYSD